MDQKAAGFTKKCFHDCSSTSPCRPQLVCPMSASVQQFVPGLLCGAFRGTTVKLTAFCKDPKRPNITIPYDPQKSKYHKRVFVFFIKFRNFGKGVIFRHLRALGYEHGVRRVKLTVASQEEIVFGLRRVHPQGTYVFHKNDKIQKNPQKSDNMQRLLNFIWFGDGQRARELRGGSRSGACFWTSNLQRFHQFSITASSTY